MASSTKIDVKAARINKDGSQFYAGPDGDLAHYTPAQILFRAQNATMGSEANFTQEDWARVATRNGQTGAMTKKHAAKVLKALAARKPGKNVRRASASLAEFSGLADPHAA